MVDDRIGNDSVEAGLRALFARRQAAEQESVIDAIRRVHKTGPAVLLRDLESDAAPVLRAPGEAPPRSSRYHVLGEIARGGVGVIYKSRDVDLARDVALKVLRRAHAGNREVIQRFLEEAQVGGQLQHPGIVPVYGLGHQADGRPYFAMKLVKGRTLSALLQARKELAEQRQHFLGIFEQVCQTMAYAHARGVVHRDLKPANVMVGAFGEVQVVDWGFSKVLSHDRPEHPAPDVSVIATLRSGDEGSQSIAGSVMGTPAYMPPEQAMGAVEHLDERSDVFALGAILCEILTGQPPYVGEARDLLMMAAHARLEDAHARLDGCGADGDLIALAKRCLHPVQGERPRDAGALVAEVDEHLVRSEERARQAALDAAEALARQEEEHARLAQERLRAEQERGRVATERSRAERERRREANARLRAEAARRARIGTIAVAAALLIAVAAGVSTYVWSRKAESDRIEGIEAAVSEGLQRASALEGRARWAEAAAEARAALALAAEAGEETRARAASVQGRIEEGKREADAAAALAREGRAFAARLEQIGLQRAGGTGEDPAPGAGLAAARAPSFDSAATEEAYAEAFRRFGIDVEAHAPEEAARRIRGYPTAVAITAALDSWAWLRRTKHKLKGSDWRRLVAIAKAADPDPWRNRLRDAAAAGDRDELRSLAATADEATLSAATLDLLGITLGEAELREEAEDLLTRAQRHHPQDLWINYHLAQALENRGKYAEMVRYATIAVSIRHDSAAAWQALSVALNRVGEPGKALRAVEEALRLDPKYAMAHVSVGVLLSAQGEKERALESYREALRCDPRCKWAYYNIGSLYWRERNDRNTTLSYYRKAVEADVSDVRFIHWLGWAYAQLERYEEARDTYLRALELNPEAPGTRANLANLYVLMGEPGKALAMARTVVDLRPDDAWAYVYLGSALLAGGQVEEAEAAYRRALELNLDDNLAVCGLGDCRLAVRDYDKAIEWYRKAVELAPSAGVYSNLGFVHSAAHDDEAAEACYRKAVQLDPRSAAAQVNLANVLLQLGREAEATGPVLEALRLSPGSGYAYGAQGRLHFQQGEYREAAAAHGEAVRRAPRAPRLRSNLAVALAYEGRFREAADQLRECLRLDAAEGTSPFERLWSRPEIERELRMLERIVELLPERAAIESGEAAPASPAESLVFARLCHCTGRHESAVRYFQIAFEGDPGLMREYDLANGLLAACSAAMAGRRDLALHWLRAQLDAWWERVATGALDEVLRARWNLRVWKRSHFLSGVRGLDDPEWKAFWSDVDKLLARALGKEEPR